MGKIDKIDVVLVTMGSVVVYLLTLLWQHLGWYP